MRRSLPLVALVLLPVLAVAQPIPCEAGMAGEFPCRNVDLLARLPLNAMPEFNESSSDIWGWTDPVTGTEYAIVLQYNHTAFVDLSDPTAPVVVGTLDAPGQAVARDGKVYADHAFLATDNGEAGVQVFDLTRLRDVAEPPTSFEADAYYTDLIGPHNFAVDEASGFGYFVGVNGAQGIQILDLSDPLNPAPAGSYSGFGSVHDLQCVTYDGPDTDHTGREICFASSPSSDVLAIIDMTDKQAPVLLSEAPYPNAAYTHQGWLTEDGRHFLLDDEFDETSFSLNTRTLVFDVEDLDDPTFAFEYTGPTPARDHNLFVHDGFAFQANYRAGLRILDLAAIDAGTLTEAAFFDTLPESDAPNGFDGAFGVYPFFESGIVVVTDMRRGLFVLQPRIRPTTGQESEVAPSDDVLLTAYPNPFGAQATIELTVPTTQPVDIAIYDLLGRRVVDVHNGPVTAGEVRRVTVDAATLPAGSYVVRATGESFEMSRAVTLVR